MRELVVLCSALAIARRDAQYVPLVTFPDGIVGADGTVQTAGSALKEAVLGAAGRMHAT
jgi:hypothetical protein